MSAVYPLSVHRRIERPWGERIKSLRQIRSNGVGPGSVFLNCSAEVGHGFDKSEHALQKLCGWGGLP
jgi:hypothetical protein